MESSSNHHTDLLPLVPIEKVNSLLTGLDKVARASVASSLEDRINPVISFSGGIDSMILSRLAKEEHGPVSLFTAGMTGSHDSLLALQIGSWFDTTGFQTLSETVSVELIETAFREVLKVVEVQSLSHLEDCAAFWLIGYGMSKRIPSSDLIVTANGPDELFCGYDRYRRILDTQGYHCILPEVTRSIKVALELKDKVARVLSVFGLRTSDPFLSKDFIQFCKEIPAETKISIGNDRIRKRLWRAYGRSLGLDERIVLKPKKAMQYSMGLHNIVMRMLKNGAINIMKEKMPALTKVSNIQQN